MSLKQHLSQVAHYNARTLQKAPLAELSGSLGDLGTLLPLMIAMALQGSIDLSTTLVFSGVTNILTGAVFGVPLPVSALERPRILFILLTVGKVQPMKAIAAVAISQKFSKEDTAAAGLTMSSTYMHLCLAECSSVQD